MLRKPGDGELVFNLSWRWADCDEDTDTKAEVVSGRDVRERKRSDFLSMLLAKEGDCGSRLDGNWKLCHHGRHLHQPLTSVGKDRATEKLLRLGSDLLWSQGYCVYTVCRMSIH